MNFVADIIAVFLKESSGVIIQKSKLFLKSMVSIAAYLLGHIDGAESVAF